MDNEDRGSSNQNISKSENKECRKGSERVVLNVGGKKFETYASTLLKFPESLLGIMFHERNEHLRKPDANGEYFFDRSPILFESVLNFYRTGKLIRIPGVVREMMEEELEFWQIPVMTEGLQEEKLGIVSRASVITYL